MLSLAPACFALAVPSEFCVCSSCIQLESILHSFPSPATSASLPPPSLAARFSSVLHRSCRPSFGQPPFTMPTTGINSFRYYFARQALTFSIRLIKLFFSSAQCLSRLPPRSLVIFFTLCRMRRDVVMRVRMYAATCTSARYFMAIDYDAFNVRPELRRYSEST